MIVRELLTRLGFQVDEAGADRYEKRIQGIEATVGRFSRVLSGALAIFGSGAALGSYLQMAGVMTDYASRVRLAIDETEDLNDAMKRLGDLANYTYSEFSTTVEGFLANNTALRELGYSTQEVLNYTQALNDAFVVSGTKGQDAASVSAHLARAMSLGVLRGDQLNAVMMRGGRITELLIERFDTNRQGLLELGRAGAITSDILYKTLIEAMGTLRQEAEDMPATFADAQMRMRTTMQMMVWSFDEASGVSSFFADNLIKLQERFHELIPVVVALVGQLNEQVDAIGGWTPILEVAAAALLLLGGPAVVRALWGLALLLGRVAFRMGLVATAAVALQDAFAWSRGHDSALESLVGEVDDYAAGLDKVRDARDQLKEGNIGDALSLAWEGADDMARTMQNNLEEALAPLREWIKTHIIDEIINYFKDKLEELRQRFWTWAAKIKNNSIAAFKEAWEGMKTSFKAALDWMKDRWNEFVGRLPPVPVPSPGTGATGAIGQGLELGDWIRRQFTPMSYQPPAGSSSIRGGDQVVNLGGISMGGFTLNVPPGTTAEQSRALIGDLKRNIREVVAETIQSSLHDYPTAEA